MRLEEGEASEMEKSRNTGQCCQVSEDQIFVPKLEVWNIFRVTSLRDLGQAVLSFHWDALPAHEYILFLVQIENVKCLPIP